VTLTGNREARMLFVVSNDYGELGNARYILYGQGRQLNNTSFLLPNKLFERNQRVFGCSTEKYSTIDQVLQTIESRQPEIVFLFSGYLFAWDGLLDVESIAKIVESSKIHGFKVVTSDPYLGLLSEPVARISDAHDSFRSLYEILQHAYHFYPVPCDHLAPSCTIRGLSTFNDKLVSDTLPPVASRAATRPRLAAEAEGASWLFVLGSNDYDVQTSALGRDLFVSKLAEKIKYSIAVGRKPMLIAPDRCNQLVRSKLGSAADRVKLISFCGYDAFTRLLLSAEAAFYWNVVSNSMFHRVLNGLPNFYFDPGHLGRIQPIYELAVKNYFAGWEPICLDHKQHLSLELLRIVDGVFRQETARMRDQYRSAPSPPDLIAAICADN